MQNHLSCVTASTYSWSRFVGKLWYSYNSGNKTDMNMGRLCLMMSRPHHPAVIPRVTTTPGGCCSVYFLLISTAHFHSFTARGVGSQLVVCVHSTQALFTMVQSLSRHTLNLTRPPQPFQYQICPRTPRRDPRSAFVDLTAGLVKHQLSIICQTDRYRGDKKHSPLVTQSCIVWKQSCL